jgi:hypothetical protein
MRDGRRWEGDGEWIAKQSRAKRRIINVGGSFFKASGTSGDWPSPPAVGVLCLAAHSQASAPPSSPWAARRPRWRTEGRLLGFAPSPHPASPRLHMPRQRRSFFPLPHHGQKQRQSPPADEVMVMGSFSIPCGDLTRDDAKPVTCGFSSAIIISWKIYMSSTCQHRHCRHPVKPEYVTIP